MGEGSPIELTRREFDPPAAAALSPADGAVAGLLRSGGQCVRYERIVGVNSLQCPSETTSMAPLLTLIAVSSSIA